MAINVVLVGVGFMGRLTARYLIEKNFNIVGVIARTSYIGEDIGEVAGLTAVGVKVETSLENVLGSRAADVAIVTTSSDMDSLAAIAEPCLKAGVNVVTISEEAFFPGFAQEYADRLDAMAKENGVSLLATGVQDIFWLNLPAMVMGACHKIESMHCFSSVNLDLYGPALASQYPFDLSSDEYEKQLEDKKESALIPTSGIALEALVAKLNLTVQNRRTRHEPIFDSVDIRSESLGRTIQAGRTCGVTEVYEIDTAEGIGLRMHFIEKLNRPDESQEIRWEFKGDPNLSFTLQKFPGEEVTCATTVNRIPDVIAAAPGFLSSGDLPPASYKLPLNNGRLTSQ